MALAVELDQLRWEINAVRRPHEQQHRAARSVGVDEHFDLLARCVFFFVGDEFEIVELEFASIKALTSHDEEVAPFLLVVTGFIRSRLRGLCFAVDRMNAVTTSAELVTQPILPRLCRFHLLPRVTFGIRVEHPSLHDLFDRLVLAVVADRVQRQFPFTTDGLLIGRMSSEFGEDIVTDSIVTAIDPRENSERLPSDNHVPRPEDRATGSVDHFRCDRIRVIGVAVNLFGERRVDFDLKSAVFADLRFAFSDHFRLLVTASPPHRDRSLAAPTMPTGIPIVVGGEPPIAATIEPIPRRDRIPLAAVSGPQHFVFDLRLSHRAAEVIVRIDGRRDLVAKCNRFLWSFDLHFELRLLVFLNAERSAAIADSIELPHAEWCVLGQFVLSSESAEFVGVHRLAEDHFPFWISQLDRKSFCVRKRVCIRLIVLGVADPHFELHLLSRAIDRSIGDREGFASVVLGVVMMTKPNVREAVIRQPACLRASDDQPLIVVRLPRITER